MRLPLDAAVRVLEPAVSVLDVELSVLSLAEAAFAFYWDDAGDDFEK